MKLHTVLYTQDIRNALQRAKAAGRVTADVELVQLKPEGSRTHPYGYLVQLGTFDQDSLPAGTTDQHGRRMNVRRYKNSGDSGAASEYYGRDGAVWAATYHEWGWFIAELFAADPTASTSASYGRYKSAEDFREQTNGAYELPVPAEPRHWHPNMHGDYTGGIR